jgi:large repetitive protein
VSKGTSAALLGLGFFAWGLVSPTAGAAATVECGDVLTAHTLVEDDLTDCADDGLVIGAPDIVVDLNGHTIDGTTAFCEEVPCTPRNQGIDNREGHDGVTIKNGTVTGFHDGVRLVEADGNILEDLTVRAFPQEAEGDRFRALTLVRSNDNQIDGVEAEGDPGLILTDSDRNTVSESNVIGHGEALSGAYGLQVVEGSDDNLVQGSVLAGDGDHIGTVVLNSRGNEIRDSELNPGADVALLVDGSEDTTITGNEFKSAVWNVSTNGTHFAHNTLVGPVSGERLVVSGSSNVILRNDVDPAAACGDAALLVFAGGFNVVKRNYVRGTLNVTAENTFVQGNYATEATCGDAGLYARRSTILKRNIAVHNTGRGIQARQRVVDAGGNRASFNGERPQCLNVVCRPARECPGFVIGNGALDECEGAPRLTDTRTRTGPTVE